jgi:Ca2+:H+ antiporter
MNRFTHSASLTAPFAGWLVLVGGAFGFEVTGVTAITLILAVLAAVHHAEVVAHKVGEPFGTLILAVSVTVIEVALIVSLMLTSTAAAATLTRDTVFAASMIILNFLLGLCLLVGSRHRDEARFTRTGATAALGTLATLLVLTLVIPNFTISASGPVFTTSQLAFVASFALVLYVTFVFVQTVSNRDYFLPKGDAHGEPEEHAPPPSSRTAWIAFGALLACLGAVVLLAKNLSTPLQEVVSAMGAPLALVGIAIAGIVLLPESIAVVRAANANRLQTSLNLALGSALATIGLTIPAVAVASYLYDLPLILGLDSKGMVLLALTLFVAAQSLARGRTTMLHGAVHLTIFAAYLVLTILP